MVALRSTAFAVEVVDSTSNALTQCSKSGAPGGTGDAGGAMTVSRGPPPGIRLLKRLERINPGAACASGQSCK